MMLSLTLFCAIFAHVARAENWATGPTIAGGGRVSICSDGTRLITGDPTDNSDAGVAKVFKLTDSTWNLLQSWPGSAGFKHGIDVAISGDGTTIAYSRRTTEHHSVLVYRDGTNGYSLYGSRIDFPVNEFFGMYIALSSDGNTLIVGARKDNGTLRVYKNTGSGWTQKGQDLVGDNISDRFETVAINGAGNIIAGGGWNHPSDDYRGYIKMFEYSDTNSQWEQMGSTQLGDIQIDGFGMVLELNSAGSRVFACASNHGGVSSFDSNAYCRVLEYSSNQWTQLGSDVTVSSFTKFGFYGAFSAEGNRLIGGNSARFEAYDYIDGTWTIVGSPAVSVPSLSGLAMSSDGSLVAAATTLSSTSTFTNYAEASAEGDPWAVMENDKIKFDSKSRGIYEELLLWSDKIILASTYESKDSFVWFDSFQFKVGTSNNIEVKLQTQLDPNQKTCNSMSVKVDGNLYLISDNATAAGDNRMSFRNSTSILAWKEQGFVGSCASNVFMFVSPELEVKLVSREGDGQGHTTSTWTRDQAIRNAHLDMQAEKVKNKEILRGPLAEMWGLTPLTDKVKSWIVDSEKGSSKSIAYPNHY